MAFILRLSKKSLTRFNHYYGNVSRRGLTISHDALEYQPIEKTSKKKKIPLHILEAVKSCKHNAKAKFDESIEVAVNLNIDPRKPNQSVRGVVQLPHGTGKTVRIAVFARGAKADLAREAGASLVGAEDLVKLIQDGNLEFDRCIATPDVMPLVGRVARILGPRGLMPNPKLGTVTQDIEHAIKSALAGQAEFRAERKGIVQASIGKVSFSEEQILENFREFMIALGHAKPSGAKGKYILNASLSSTMGKGYCLDLPFVDPSSNRFMLNTEVTGK